MTAPRARFQKNDLLSPDVYEGWLADVEEKDSGKGSYYRWKFIANADGKERKLSANSGLTLSSGSKGGKWLKAIANRELLDDEPVEFAAYLGRKCRLVVDVDETGQYNVITDILPAKGQVPLPLPEPEDESDDLPFANR